MPGLPAANSLLPLNLSTVRYGLGYLVGFLVFLWIARRRGLNTVGVRGVAIAGLLGGLVGANVTQWLATGQPGKTVLGGVAGGYLAVILYKRYIGLRRPTGDLFAVAVCAGEAIGRWGCFFGGCCHGRPSEVPWAVLQHDVLRHPTQVYLSLASLLVLGVLLYREFRAPLPENGLFYLQGLLYAALRFAVEFFREATPHGGLTTAQWACLVGIVFFGYRFYRQAREVRLVRAREAPAVPAASVEVPHVVT
jgi:phosphatidylglycerol---prolipoprotein diacylglyceryl transferase